MGISSRKGLGGGGGGGGFASTGAGRVPFGNGTGALIDDPQFVYHEDGNGQYVTVTTSDTRTATIRAHHAGVAGTTFGAPNSALTVFGSTNNSVVVGNNASTIYLSSGDAVRLSCPPGGTWRNVTGWRNPVRRWASGTTALAADDFTLALTGTTGGTVTLPASPDDGRECVVKDLGLNAAVSALVIDGNGKNIVGSSSAGTLSISTNGGAYRLQYDATGNVWMVV